MERIDFLFNLCGEWSQMQLDLALYIVHFAEVKLGEIDMVDVLGR
jgi:hypothetical protein